MRRSIYRSQTEFICTANGLAFGAREKLTTCAREKLTTKEAV